MEQGKVIPVIIIHLYLVGAITMVTGEVDLLNTTFPKQWIPTSLPTRTDLLCPCENIVYPEIFGVGDEHEQCCICKAYPHWFHREVTDAFYIEYVSVFHQSIVISDRPVNINAVYNLIFPEENLPEFPINICNWDSKTAIKVSKLYGPMVTDFQDFWPRIVMINISHNKIQNFTDINCLINLDTIDLRNNLIEHVANKSFQSLPHLRQLYLQRNRIKTMDVAVFCNNINKIWFVDLSENQLSTLDVTNMHSQFEFCTMNFEKNDMQTLTNLSNFTLEMDQSYGPGFVSFKGNSFNTFPDFKELFNLQNLSNLGLVINSGFDFQDTEFDCNCHMELYCELAEDLIKSLWRDYMDVKCSKPEHLRGVAVVNVSLEQFVCDLSEDKDCPAGCTCVDQPSLRTVHVDCADTGKTELPRTVPHSKYSTKYNLDLSGNAITVLSDVPYLSQVSSLNLSDNKLKGIDEDAAAALENTMLDISENKEFKTIPQNLQHRSMCNLQMNNLHVICDCDTSWISSWVSVKGCNNSNFICDVPGVGSMPANKFSKDLLDCQESDGYLETLSGILAALILLLGIAGVIIIYFRYEVLILSLRLRRLKKTAVVPNFKYDVFLSFDEENDYLRKWVNGTLNSHLQMLGYQTFVPCKDLQFGGVRETETIMKLCQTRHFILILSESYLTQEESILIENEWRYGWNMYRANAAKKIIIINYDYISSFDVQHPQIKAYLRVGDHIDFANHQGNIMDTIVKKLGPPCVKDDKSMDNKRVKFNHKLFQAQNYYNGAPDIEKYELKIPRAKLPPIVVVNENNIPNTRKHDHDNLYGVANLITERKRPVNGQFKYYI